MKCISIDDWDGNIFDDEDPDKNEEEQSEIVDGNGNDRCLRSSVAFDVNDSCIELPEYLSNNIDFIVPPLIDESWSCDIKILKEYFDQIEEIIIKGDKPNGADDDKKGKSKLCNRNYAPGLSCHNHVSASYDSPYNTPIQYFWMSWLMSHIPIIIVPFRETMELKWEKDKDKNHITLYGLYTYEERLHQPVIYIYLKTIQEDVNNGTVTDISVEELVYATVIHELAHAVMDIAWNIDKNDIGEGPVKYGIKHVMSPEQKKEEEAWANALMLLYIKRFYGENSNTFNHILAFTKKQPSGYNEGAAYMKKYEDKEECWYDWYLEKCNESDETSDAK